MVYGVNDLLTDIAGLQAYGGGDCPEYGVTGIQRALQLIYNTSYEHDTNSNNNIIVLTDASAKDAVGQDLFLLFGSPVRIHFFFSGTGCDGDFPTYKMIANTYQQDINSNKGIIVNEISVEGLELFFEALNADINMGKRNTDNCHSLDISTVVTGFQVILLTSEPSVEITMPDGTTFTVATIGNSFAVYKDSYPQPGSWSMCVALTGQLTVELTFSTSLELAIKYVKQTNEGHFLPTSDIISTYTCVHYASFMM